MNRKITIRIGLIITAFLILSSSLFAPIYPDALDGLDELGEAIRMFFLTVIIVPIVIIVIMVALKKSSLIIIVIPVYFLIVLFLSQLPNIIDTASEGIDRWMHRDYYSLTEASSIREIELLIKKGVNINAKDKYGYTALMRASR